MKWIYITVLIGIAVSILLSNKNKNNVCKTFRDYYSNRDNNPSCYYNPDYKLEVPDIIKRHGYPVEIHHASTLDGHILTLFRIPHGLYTNTTGNPVFVQHGLSLNSGAFVLSGRKSLGFVLADAGYDVWLGNFRGSRYSRRHHRLDPQNEDFWNFGLHELGIYDLPAQINHIVNVTHKKISYIGNSMGSTAGYIYSSEYPDDARKSLELFIGLAPITSLDNIPLFKIISYVWLVLARPLKYLSNGEIYPRPPLPQVLHRYICFPFPIQMDICGIPDMIVLGWNYAENDPETLPASLIYNNDAVSVKIISHYLQIVLSGLFSNFDYGTSKNLEIYGNVVPPVYNISKVNIPHYLIYASNDKTATPENVEKLFKSLPTGSHSHKLYKIKNEDYTHMDIISGKNAHHFVYNPLINFLRTGSQ